MMSDRNATAAALSLEHVTYSFGKNVAVQDFSLEVEQGSFTTLLGPSGCGKTTLLRMISGFLTPQSGTVRIDGADQRGIAPNLRKVGMVFQDYALFPHLTVEQNLLYGLKLRKDIAKDARSGLIFQTARILGLSALLERYPHELSGGQQQRVALGRVLVLKPRILLMDEPLSSLDAKLRTQVREELQDIQRELAITTVYVTHDQEEALSLSDRIAVLNHGSLQQAGAPDAVYFTPANRFVADFVGRANFIETSAGVRMVRPEWVSVRAADDAGAKEGDSAKASTTAVGSDGAVEAGAKAGDAVAENSVAEADDSAKASTAAVIDDDAVEADETEARDAVAEDNAIEANTAVAEERSSAVAGDDSANAGDGAAVAATPAFARIAGSATVAGGAHSADATLTGTVLSASFLGAVVRYRVRCATVSGGVAVVDAPAADSRPLAAGAAVTLTVRKSSPIA